MTEILLLYVFWKWSHVLEKSGSRVMDPFPMIQNPEKWTHLGFSKKWLPEFRSND